MTVQLEHGYTRIANELLQAIMITDFTVGERAVIDAVIRLTYGYQKKQAEIAYSQMAKMTGLHRQTVARVAGVLAKSKVLGVAKGTLRRPNIFWLNKDYSQWGVNIRVYKSVSAGAYRGVNATVNHIKKEKKRKKVEDLKLKFFKEHQIN